MDNDCRPGEPSAGGYEEYHGIKSGDTNHIFCASNGEVDLAPGLRIRLKAVEGDEGTNANPGRDSSWVEVTAPAYANHWYQVREVKSQVTNDYARISWDPPQVTSGASKFLDSFFSIPRRVSYDILIKTDGGTRTDDDSACGSGAHVHFNSRYGRVVTVRKGTLKPGCKYLAEIEALYSSAITGIPAILGVDAAPGKQLSKGTTSHSFAFTEPQRNLVLGAALLRRAFRPLFMGIFARGRSLLGALYGGTAFAPACFRAARGSQPGLITDAWTLRSAAFRRTLDIRAAVWYGFLGKGDASAMAVVTTRFSGRAKQRLPEG